MTQINTPYPATAYLTAHLKQAGHDVLQADLALELLLTFLSREGLSAVKREIESQPSGNEKRPKGVRNFLYWADRYLETVEPVVRYLQGKDRTLAHRITHEEFLPRGPRFNVLSQMDEEAMDWAFGALGVHDRAQYLASLFIDDIADVLRESIDPRFELARYAEKLAASAPSFDPMVESLKAQPTLIDRTLDRLAEEKIKAFNPELIGITVPFPGNAYGAFRIAQTARRISPSTPIVFGGGYVNTELRELKDPRVFDFVDYITLDDGERPLLAIVESLVNKKTPPKFLRTLARENGIVVMKDDKTLHDIPFKNSPTPTYEGLFLDKYLSLCEMPNPMHRLWSDGRWNKLTVAHGCYWKKCSFCDTTLDYIGRYEPQSADRLVDHIEKLVAETGESGFHFVDEAAPPAVLAAMAERLIQRKVQITWWANIRFEKTFTKELVELLARSGCIAMSGGLEVASDRLLELMEKGVTVDQVARVTNHFADAGILVHAYLMFGFPTQNEQETIDSLERVRQLFLVGCIQSAFWHRFSATVHSPVGKNPAKYGIKLLPTPSTFANNDVPFEDPTGVDHDRLHAGLKKALYNFMHGIGLEEDVREWFDFPVPRPKVPAKWIQKTLNQPSPEPRPKGGARGHAQLH